MKYELNDIGPVTPVTPVRFTGFPLPKYQDCHKARLGLWWPLLRRWIIRPVCRSCSDIDDTAALERANLIPHFGRSRQLHVRRWLWLAWDMSQKFVDHPPLPDLRASLPDSSPQLRRWIGNCGHSKSLEMSLDRLCSSVHVIQHR